MIELVDPSHAAYHALHAQLRRTPTQFAWDVGGLLILFADQDVLVAYAVLCDGGVELFEVMHAMRGRGIGTHCIQALKARYPDLSLSGYPKGRAALAFWRKQGLL